MMQKRLWTVAPAGAWLVLATVIAAGAAAAGPALFSACATLEPVPGRTAQSADTPPFDRPDNQDAFDPDVPAPESFFGESFGNRAVRYDELVRYLQLIAEKSPRVTLNPYAVSHEGRTLYYLTVTSEANHANLEYIRNLNGVLADPRQLTNANFADQIVDELPAVAWMAYAIHGDELSPTDAAVEVLYQLAAREDDAARALRESLVIHLDPLQNPDGRERFLTQIESMRGKVENPDIQALHHTGDWSRGRGNHYLFDLNRDWLMMAHPETQGRAREILRWNPHLLVDSHEMSGLDTYLFDPPREPLNIQLSPTVMEWRRAFSADHAAAFDDHGWSYYTEEWYDEWYPGYTNAWANLIGAVGILYEAAALGATAVKQQSGEVRHYRETIHQNVVGTFANLETLRANRKQILRDYFEDRRWAVSGEGPHNETLILKPSSDDARMNRLLDLLDHQGIEYGIAAEPFTARKAVDWHGKSHDAIDLPSGSVVVTSSQPRRRLLHAILGFDPRMTADFLHDERGDLEQGRGSQIYDITAWNLTMAYALDAVWAEEVNDLVMTEEPPGDDQAPPLTHDGYGYLFDSRSSEIYTALVMMFEEGLKPRVASEPFTVHDRQYDRGTILLRRHEQPEHVAQAVQRIADSTTLHISDARTALAQDGPDLGGQRFHLLEKPRVAIAAQWPVSTTSFGTYWQVFDDRIGLRVSPINIQHLASFDLRKYNVLILPDAGGAVDAVVDRAALDNIRQWVKQGGTLIASGRSAAMLAREASEISSVRLRRNVLDELNVYAEYIQRERGSRRIEIDIDEVWGRPYGPESNAAEAGDGDDPQNGEPPDDEPADVFELPDDSAGRKRLDEWQRRFSPQGAIVLAEVDPRHWLSFNLPAHIPVLATGPYVFMSHDPVETPVRKLSGDQVRLAGLLWPEARFRLADSAYATVESLGHGQVILFAADPFYRSYFEGTGRMILNAVMYGPGLGANPPLPW